MKMLFLSRWFPYPSDNGARQRIAALLRALTQRHEVHLLSFIDHEDASARAMAEQVGLMAVHTVPYPKAGRGWPFAGIASGGPRSLAQKHSLLMQDYAFDLVVNDRFDVVVASEIDMLPYAVALPVAQRVLDGLEVGMHHDTLTQPWLRGGLRARVRWSRLTNYLQRNLAEFVLCTTVSEHERRLIDRYVAPACALIVTPNGVDVSACAQVRGAPRPDTLIYAGALTYAANFDAVEYCITSILPRVRAERPAVRLLVTGAAPPELVARLPSDPSVEYTGYLKDVRAAVASCWVSVAPVRIGSGTRLKILESMALGVPVVATGKGAEGLELQPGESILIGDDPDRFARHVVNVLPLMLLLTASVVRSPIWSERFVWLLIIVGVASLAARTFSLPIAIMLDNGTRGLFVAWSTGAAALLLLYRWRASAWWWRAAAVLLLAGNIYHYFFCIACGCPDGCRCSQQYSAWHGCDRGNSACWCLQVDWCSLCCLRRICMTRSWSTISARADCSESSYG